MEPVAGTTRGVRAGAGPVLSKRQPRLPGKHRALGRREVSRSGFSGAGLSRGKTPQLDLLSVLTVITQLCASVPPPAKRVGWDPSPAAVVRNLCLCSGGRVPARAGAWRAPCVG